MTEWHPDPDQLVALALADVAGDEQERLVAHLAGCSACRDEYAQLSDGLQQTLTAAVSIAPPAGFSGRVLAAMESGSDVQPIGRPPRMRLLMVACLLAGLLLGIGGSVGVYAWLHRPQPQVPSTLSAPTATRLLTADGAEVGSVGLTRRDGKAYLLLNVTAGRRGARYDCILVGPDGARLNGGSWTLNDEYGRASGSWLVPLTGEPPVAVELIAPTGTVWARGAF